jgi:hypothetical protein
MNQKWGTFVDDLMFPRDADTIEWKSKDRSLEAGHPFGVLRELSLPDFQLRNWRE